MSTAAEAWQAFCDRMAALGPVIEAEAPTPEAAAEGLHHLANQVACWLTYGIGSSDPMRPVFFRSSDPVYEWGGPNADQVARRAAISGDAVYRITGTMGGCEEFVLQIKRGAAQSGGAGVATEVSASALGLGPGDAIDIVLGGPEPSTATDGRVRSGSRCPTTPASCTCATCTSTGRPASPPPS